VDERGKPLTFFDLKAGREVTVEIRGEDTRVRKTIIVKR
jgi:predicted DNA-binding antitoxin AbrB/MazE fold protein